LFADSRSHVISSLVVELFEARERAVLRTSCPDFAKALDNCDPTNPLAPVTRIFISST
jgi:hypothetical protein